MHAEMQQPPLARSTGYERVTTAIRTVTQAIAPIIPNKQKDSVVAPPLIISPDIDPQAKQFIGCDFCQGPVRVSNRTAPQAQGPSRPPPCLHATCSAAHAKRNHHTNAISNHPVPKTTPTPLAKALYYDRVNHTVEDHSAFNQWPTAPYSRKCRKATSKEEQRGDVMVFQDLVLQPVVQPTYWKNGVCYSKPFFPQESPFVDPHIPIHNPHKLSAASVVHVALQERPSRSRSQSRKDPLTPALREVPFKGKYATSSIPKYNENSYGVQHKEASIQKQLAALSSAEKLLKSSQSPCKTTSSEDPSDEPPTTNEGLELTSQPNSRTPLTPLLAALHAPVMQSILTAKQCAKNLRKIAQTDHHSLEFHARFHQLSTINVNATTLAVITYRDLLLNPYRSAEAVNSIPGQGAHIVVLAQELARLSNEIGDCHYNESQFNYQVILTSSALAQLSIYVHQVVSCQYLIHGGQLTALNDDVASLQSSNARPKASSSNTTMLEPSTPLLRSNPSNAREVHRALKASPTVPIWTMDSDGPQRQSSIHALPPTTTNKINLQQSDTSSSRRRNDMITTASGGKIVKANIGRPVFLPHDCKSIARNATTGMIDPHGPPQGSFSIFAAKELMQDVSSAIKPLLEYSEHMNVIQGAKNLPTSSPGRSKQILQSHLEAKANMAGNSQAPPRPLTNEIFVSWKRIEVRLNSELKRMSRHVEEMAHPVGHARLLEAKLIDALGGALKVDDRHRDRGAVMDHHFKFPKGYQFIHHAHTDPSKQPWEEARGRHIDHL